MLTPCLIKPQAIMPPVMPLCVSFQAISFIAALLGKQGTTQDGLPRSFAAFRRQRQQQRLKQQELVDDEDDEEEEQEAVADANSAIRWPVLVVCPTSVLDNWMRELNMWGTFKVCGLQQVLVP